MELYIEKVNINVMAIHDCCFVLNVKMQSNVSYYWPILVTKGVKTKKISGNVFSLKAIFYTQLYLIYIFG